LAASTFTTHGGNQTPARKQTNLRAVPDHRLVRNLNSIFLTEKIYASGYRLI